MAQYVSGGSLVLVMFVGVVTVVSDSGQCAEGGRVCELQVAGAAPARRALVRMRQGASGLPSPLASQPASQQESRSPLRQRKHQQQASRTQPIQLEQSHDGKAPSLPSASTQTPPHPSYSTRKRRIEAGLFFFPSFLHSFLPTSALRAPNYY